MILNFQQREKSQNLYSPNSDFGAYLHISKDELFVLDLSQATLLEVIEEQIKMKQNLSPRYGKGLSCLKKHLKFIEEQFGCTLMPIQITDIFWHHFTHYLQSKGLSISSIKTLCSQLRSALSWASRHRAIISPSYDVNSDRQAPHIPRWPTHFCNHNRPWQRHTHRSRVQNAWSH